MNYVFCNGHGVGMIIGEEQGLKKIRLSNQMTVITNKYRDLSSGQEISNFYATLEKEIKPSNETWNRRYRKYMDTIKTGNLNDYADVLTALRSLKKIKTLSFGERKLLNTIVETVSLEISIVTRKDINQIQRDLA